MPVDETPIPLDAEALEAAREPYHEAVRERDEMWRRELPLKHLPDPLAVGIRAYLSCAARQQDTGAERFVKVPRYPSPAMVDAYNGALKAYLNQLSPEERAQHRNKRFGLRVKPITKVLIRWDAMLAAAPTPPDQGGATT